MISRRSVIHFVTAFFLSTGSVVVWAQSFPQRPLKIVVPFAAGGSTDVMARLVGQRMSESLGQPVVIENRPGAGGAIASEQVAKSPADGYTLLMATTSTHAILPLANPRLSYDPRKDFASVGLVAKATNVLVVSPLLGVKDVRGLIQMLKNKPGELSFASSGNGTITHLVAESFLKSAGAGAIHVPYKTGVQAMSDLSAGLIAFQFDSITWTLPQAKAGKLIALATSDSKRSSLAPDLPTLAEAGLPGFEGVTWFGFVSPIGTPPAILSRLSAELAKALQSTELQAKIAAQGAEPSSGSADELSQLMVTDAVKWGRVIREAGVKFE